MSIADSMNPTTWFGSDPEQKLIDGLEGLLGDGDAVLLFPYDDGTFYLKRGYFDKELVGGIGGYETDDGDKVVVDGDGTPERQLYGVPMLLACDPTEHAAAVDVIKALVAHKNNIGEWLRVDKDGAVVDAGDAVEPVTGSGVDTETLDEYAKENGLADHTGQPDRHAALVRMAERGEITKIYDIAPPSTTVVEDGEIEVESATHTAVDQAAAADLLPTTMDTVELNTALDRARMEEHEEGKLMKYFTYGMIAGVVVAVVLLVVMFLMFQIGGGVF